MGKMGRGRKLKLEAKQKPARKEDNNTDVSIRN